MKKAIFFDLGNTIYTDKNLLEVYREHIYKFLAEKLDLEVSQAKDYFKKTRAKLEKEREKHINKSDVLVHLGFSHDDAYEGYRKINPKDYLKKDKKLANLFDRLAKKYTLGIITNDSCELTERVLEALGINKNLFTILVTYESVKNKKPDREPFEVAIRHLKGGVANCYYIADSIEKDLKPAKEAGMKTVWVTNEKRESTDVDYKIKDLFRLPEILNSL